ncbi:MAG: hypothetical protein R3362_06530, partial [Rhodothermales bacterium]|nr:hypothetical protein [Rhodothermales bacterium]
MDPARALFGLAVVDGAAYLIGGYSPFGPLDAVQRYRIGQGNQSLPPLKVARGGLTAAAAGG